MAAAAAWSGSRGGAGGRFFLFTLLCLVCLASSRLEEDNLKKLKGNVQKVEEQIALMQAQRGFLSEFMTLYDSYAAPMMASGETFIDESAADSLLKGILEKVKSLMRDSRALMNELNKYVDAEIADMELKVVNGKKLIKRSEEYLAEL